MIDQDGNQVGIVDTKDAFEQAVDGHREIGLDHILDRDFARRVEPAGHPIAHAEDAKGDHLGV